MTMSTDLPTVERRRRVRVRVKPDYPCAWGEVVRNIGREVRYQGDHLPHVIEAQELAAFCDTVAEEMEFQEVGRSVLLWTLVMLIPFAFVLGMAL